MKSKAMKKLLASLEALKVTAEGLMSNEEATLEEIQNNSKEIDTIMAKIEMQKKIDGDKEFDENGEEVKDMTPVNGVIPAEPKQHKDKPFKSFGEQLTAIARVTMNRGSVDNRLLEIQNATGASEGIPSDGGYLVQTDLAEGLLKDVYETAVLPGMCSKVPIGANANAVTLNGFDETDRAAGSRYGGVRGYWLEEGGTITSSKPKYRQIELKPKKMATLYYATDELLSDASALGNEVRAAFINEMGFMLDDAIINGDGAGKPLGVLNSGALITQAKETGQAADSIVVENLWNMYSRLLPPSMKNAVWLINQELLPQLYGMVLSAGTSGVPVYMPAGGVSGAPYSTIFGRPVMPIEQCAALGDKGDIILGDFSQYKLADKGGIKSAESMHVAFTTDEMCFRTTYRVDGQTARASALTPYKGAATVSHFVTLIART